MDPVSLKKNWADGMVLDKNLLNADATAIEAVINKLLTSVTDGDSGGDAIKMTPVAGVGDSQTNTAQKAIEALKALIDALTTTVNNVTLGQIPDGAITVPKLSFDPATQTELNALSGTGNTHTVKEAYDLASAAQVISLLTTAGDLLGRDSGALIRIPKGTANQVLGMNNNATAQQYMASLQSLLTSAGDLIYGSSANTPARLAKGADGTVMKMISGLPAWATEGYARGSSNLNGQAISTTYNWTIPLGFEAKQVDIFVHSNNGNNSSYGCEYLKVDRGGSQVMFYQHQTATAQPLNEGYPQQVNYSASLSTSLFVSLLSASISGTNLTLTFYALGGSASTVSCGVKYSAI